MNNYNAAAKRFARDIGPHRVQASDEPMRPHEMKILLDQGLYRHLRFRSPDHSTYWFELITVPGSLTFRGDGDSFVFARAKDMFEFFRFSSWKKSINPTYWSEKLTSARDAAFKYDEESFRAQVWEYVRPYGGEYRGLAKAVQAYFFDGWAEYNFHNEDEARAGLNSFKYVPDDSTLKPFEFVDTWEWNFQGFDWWFLWACHAIVWGIAQYDTAKTRTVAAPADTVAPLVGAVSE